LKKIKVKSNPPQPPFCKGGRVRVPPLCKGGLGGIFLLLCFFASLLLSSCQFKVPKDPETLVTHLMADPGILNPILSTDAFSFDVMNYIYETLIEMDNKTLEYKPLLAESWDVSDDHLQFTFHLRKDVKWQDGVPFTAEDVLYSYNKIQDPKVDAAVSRVSFRDVKKVEMLDKYTVRFTYAKPYFRALLVCGAISVIPKHIYDNGVDFNTHPANRHPIGTGPFMFKEWKTKQKVVLVKNPNYWRDPPKIDSIVFKIIEDQTVPFQELKKGDIDLMGIRPIQWERETDTKSFESQFNKAEYYLPQFSYIGWNLRRPFFSDKRVRHAMSMMVDKESFLKKIMFGHGVIVEGDQYYFGSAYDRSIKPDPFDPEGAKRLLDEAGWIDHDGDGLRDKDGVSFKFDYYYASASVGAAQMGTMLREDLQKIGILMDLRGLEFNALIKVLNEHSFDAVTLAWTVPLENDPYQVWHSSQVKEGSNYIGFENKEADKIIEEIRVEFSKNKRDELFKKLQQILHDEQPYTFLFNQASLVAYNKRFTNVKVYKLGLDIREWGVDNKFKR